MECLWIGGVSRVGKATLAQALESSAAQRALLTVDGPATLLPGSADNPPQPFTPEGVAVEAAQHDRGTLLIKWQLRNADQGHIQKVMRLLPEARHRVLVVQAAPDDVLARWGGARPYLQDRTEQQRRQDLAREQALVQIHLLDAAVKGLTVQCVGRVGEHFRFVPRGTP